MKAHRRQNYLLIGEKCNLKLSLLKCFDNWVSKYPNTVQSTAVAYLSFDETKQKKKKCAQTTFFLQ